MAIKYVHAEYLKKCASDNNNVNQALFQSFYRNKYLKMRRKVKGFDYANDSDAFKKCADVLNDYFADVKSLEMAVSLSDNSKLHTDFMEEFSCYFLEQIPQISGFDNFTKNVFAGLRLKTDQSISVITKDVDFCVGKSVKMKLGRQNIVLNIPIISVEMKTYVEKTMLGEIVNTARKIKGANPRSKCILLTWVKSFTEDSVIEIASESYLDEIVVMSSKKRKKGTTPVEFTEEGLKAYWEVISEAIEEALMDYNMPSLGRFLSYARIFNGFTEEGD